ncbi:conjugative transfer relaxase/helicase TraI [Legionella wadsworthii]|nr:conjugative transfer relaxase/helicase TraI [Legionella wadsworthii]
MLSLRVKPIKMPGYYFDKENYYFSNQLTTEWVGLSAERQNLSGEVNVLSLEAVVRGALPSGDVIGLKTQSGEIKHRGGYDLTFSAPKSVSYLGLVCGHKEFIDLHLNAIKTVLKLIEKEAAEARKSGKEGMEYEKTGNLCFATILHDTSREQDPQLHVHALLMNFTERLDGKWRALASDISRNHGTMEWIMDNQIFLGLVYRSEIALGLKEMGLEIEHTGDAHGLFEIKHFDKTLLERMSKRRTQVEEHIKGMHSNSLKAYDRATLDSRKSKEVVSPEELRMRWKAESEALGVNPATYLATLKDKTKESHELQAVMSNKELDKSVLDAIAHLEEKKLTFTYQEVLQTSLYFSLGEQGFEALMSRIDQEIDAQNLIALNTENSCFTTSKLINKEQELIKKIVNFTHQKKGIERNTDKVCKLTDNESIQKAVTQALFSKDGVVRIKQQSATSRELLSTLIDYSQDSKKIRILCPSAFSANTINKDMAKSAPTLWQWILSIGKQDLCETVAGFNYRHGSEHKLPFFHSKKEREVLIVDEAQRLAPDEMNTLLSIADRRCAKVIFLEKSQSLSGFKSDIPDLLNKASIKSFEVDDKKVPATSINLIEAQTVEGRILKTAQMYCNLPVNQRQNTKVFTVSKLEAKEVNEAIRTQLKEQGEISSDEKTINTLTRIPLTLSEKKLAKSYQSNWILIHNTRTESKKFTVLGINEKDNQLIVRNSNGARSLLAAKNITDSMQIYEQTPLSVGIGDQLVATASLSFEGLKIGNRYEVTAFTRHGIKIRDGKRSIHLITSNEKHFPLSHAYAKTMYSDDLKSVKQTIMTLPAYALKQNTMSLLCESSKEKVMIITDNVDKANRFAMKTATKSSAISLTLDAAKTNHGAQIIDHRTTSDLLSSLEQALTLLTAKKPQKSDAEKALNFAIAHLSEREAAFTRSDLLEVAVHQAMGKAGLNEIDNVLGNAINSGDLISGGNEFLTTKEAVAFEESIIKNVKAGINILKPLMSSGEARKQLELTDLTKGQKEACELITTTSDQFIMIQGYAGTGKTTMTRSAIDTIKHAQSMTHEEVELIAVAPTHQAVKEMRALGIEAQTLKSFLIEQEQESTLSKKTLVLLDESSMVSNRDCANLMQKIHHSGARCAMLGDISQHQSIESGKPSKILIQEGSIRVACMDDLVRQQAIEYKKAIETLIAGDIDQALAQLANQPLDSITRTKAVSPYHDITSSIIETGDSTKDYLQLESTQQQSIDPFQEELKQKNPIEMAVGDYLSRTPSCRDNTIVIIHENKKREVANGLIRDALMKESTLGSENKEFPRLLSTNYTTAELYYCETYRDCLKKQEEYFLKKGEHYFKVVSVDESAKVVVLNDVKGNKCLFVPEKENKDWKIELFQSMPGRVSVGEKIHFKKSDKTLGRFANERVQVTEVNNESFTVKDSSGVEHVLQKKLMSDSHWDYSYTATSYSIQGASSPFVIGVAETKNALVNHLRSFYIMVTRGSLHAMIYTDNYKKLQKQLRVTPEKTSALESLNHLNVQTKPPIPNAPSTSLKAAQSMPIMKYQEPRYDANMLSQHLSDQAELVIESLLGQPNQALSSKTEYRYGTHGSLSLCLSGEKRGVWHNFETKEKGNMLHLIQKTLNLNFKESLEYAAKLTGDDLKERIKIASKNPNNLQVKDTDKKRKTSDYGLQLVRESKPISGTIAERYLKEIRKIHNVSGENIRFHPNVYTKDTEEVRYRPALLNIARDKDNKVACVEVVYLDNKTANKAIMKIKPKKSYGSKAGVGVVLSEGTGHESVTYITEGVETGLSVRDAVQNERVIATLGKENFVNIDMALLTDKIVICMDNDGKSIKEDKVIIQTIERLKQHGKTVEIAIPLHQKDFNDVNKSSGVQGVVDILNKATNVDKFIGCPNKIDMNQDQIKKCLESISRQMNLELPENKNNPIEKLKTLQREEMEIY